jgi:predicted NUDIX family phosphoesterase/dephospho-CoA kinase
LASEFLLVAEKILSTTRQPMSARQLVSYARDEGMFSENIAGKTPYQTMKAKLSVDIRRRGEASRFVRTKPGKFFLRELVEGDVKVYKAAPLTPPAERRRVLVFPSTLLDDIGRFQGIKKPWRRIARQIFGSSTCQYLDRLDAEGNDDYKQVLTYIMVRRGSFLLAYKRGTYNRVEEFLRGSQCIGFGGHVSENDLGLFSLSDFGVVQSAKREIFEELTLPGPDRANITAGKGLELLGVLNDDSSAVGRRHFAFVFQYEVSGESAWDNVKRGEKSITQLRWIDPAEPDFLLWEFEYWSQLCFREFFAASLKAHPAYRVRRRSRLKPPNIVLVLGPAGSGKSEATRILKTDFGYQEINSGKVVASILGIPPVPTTPRLEFQEKAYRFIREEGSPHRLAEGLWNAAKDAASDRILIDGIRQKETVEELRMLASGSRGIGLLYVHTPPDIAYRFYCGRQSTAIDMHDFLRMREAPVERDVEALIAVSDAVLYNWTGQREYRRVIRELMSHMGIQRL